jgi:UDP-N-acetylglucosamine 4-epimerase
MNILITGGAGFIGSNLVKFLLDLPQINLVRVLDNFATGKKENIQAYIGHPKFQLIEGDIQDLETCMLACNNIQAISHQAALGSVPRSIKEPLNSHRVNVNGFLNMLEAAKLNNIQRVVYASSSSVYGDLNESPKVETRVGKVLSPYAATKMANELYAEAYAKNYGMSLVGLRYFNVFGPQQDPNGPYAAVIPLFIKAALSNTSPIINGDGSITRDFTPISNVVQINHLALTSDLLNSMHYVFNVACGQTTTLKELWLLVKEITASSAEPIYGPTRKGDILASLADVSFACKTLGYKPDRDLYSHLKNAIDFYRGYF